MGSLLDLRSCSTVDATHCAALDSGTAAGFPVTAVGKTEPAALRVVSQLRRCCAGPVASPARSTTVGGESITARLPG